MYSLEVYITCIGECTVYSLIYYLESYPIGIVQNEAVAQFGTVQCSVHSLVQCTLYKEIASKLHSSTFHFSVNIFVHVLLRQKIKIYS